MDGCEVYVTVNVNVTIWPVLIGYKAPVVYVCPDETDVNGGITPPESFVIFAEINPLSKYGVIFAPWKAVPNKYVFGVADGLFVVVNAGVIGTYEETMSCVEMFAEP